MITKLFADWIALSLGHCENIAKVQKGPAITILIALLVRVRVKTRVKGRVVRVVRVVLLFCLLKCFIS